MDPVSAVAQAIGQIFGTIGSFVNAGAQRYGMQKSIEAGGIDASRKKSLMAYSGVASSQTTILLLIAALIVIVLIFKSRK